MIAAAGAAALLVALVGTTAVVSPSTAVPPVVREDLAINGIALARGLQSLGTAWVCAVPAGPARAAVRPEFALVAFEVFVDVSLNIRTDAMRAC